MKKVFAIFAIAALTACGGSSTEATNAPVDSTNALVDTTAKGGSVIGELSTEGKAEAIAPEEIK